MSLPKLLTFAFNGQPCEVARKDGSGRLRPLSAMMDDAARATGNTRYWVGVEERWDARDVRGTVLDPEQPIRSLKERGHADVYVNLRPGIGA